MPNAPKRPCSGPGCHNLVTSGKCTDCQKKEQRNYDRNHRNKDAKKFYNSALWKALSEACKQRASGLCEQCRADGLTVLGKQAAHIISREEGGPDELDNLRWLCLKCHGREGAQRGERWG